MFKPEVGGSFGRLVVLTALVVLIAATVGLAAPSLALPAAPGDELPFLFGQDAIALLAALTLLALAWFAGPRADLARVAIVGYLAYGYGVYVVGGLYSWLYFGYLAVFGLCLFVLLLAVRGFEGARLDVGVPGGLRLTISAVLALIVVYFAPQWLIDLAGIIGAGGGHATHYVAPPAVDIFDLVMVLPLCAFAALRLLRPATPGIAALGLALIGFGAWLMLSVAAGFWFQPLFGSALDVGNAVTFGGIAVVLAGLVGASLATVRFGQAAT